MNAKNRALQRPLRPGDVVEVRTAAEILATLDADAAVDKIPFMPEMAQLAGQRFTVSRRVDKICDTIGGTGSRRMLDTVYLEDLRCDGSGHGGCQAGCRIYWKDAWLRRVENGAATEAQRDDEAGKLERLAAAGTRTVREAGAEEVWRCQATEAFKATEPLKTSNLAQYWREARNGNYGPRRFIRLMARALVMEIASRAGVMKPLPLYGPGTQTPPAEPSNVQSGELVRVRSEEEILPTLDETGHSRRLSFDREMVPYCGRTVRVKTRVEKIIEDKTGRMIKIPKDTLILDGAVCSGQRTPGAWFCPRQIYPFWRDAWVEPAGKPDGEA